MLPKVVIYCLVVMVLLPNGYAAPGDLPEISPDTETTNTAPPTLAEANRFLSAEATKAIKKSQDELLQSLIANQDANTLALDNEMRNLMNDIRMKVILGVLGVIILAQGIAAYFLVVSFKNNSYERYLEEQLALADARRMETSPTARELQGVVEHQQQEWQPQAPSQSYGAQLGQTGASQQTMANQWQTEPAYAGAWESPVQPYQEYQESPQLDETLNQFVEMTQPPYQEYDPQQQNQNQYYQG
jgi:hypothetical protein